MDDLLYQKIKKEIDYLTAEIKSHRKYVDESMEKIAKLTQMCVDIAEKMNVKED